MTRLSNLVLALLLCALGVGCTDKVLLATEGDADADADADGDDGADGDADAEVEPPPDLLERIVVVMDQSGSLQCTDAAMHRQTFVTDLVDAHRGDPGVAMAYVGYHAAIYLAGFTTPDELQGAMAEHMVQLGPATDYQGALATVRDLIRDDASALPTADLGRARYSVIFLSDGVPEPQCDHGCEDDTTACSDGVDNDGDSLADDEDPDCEDTYPDQLYGVCNHLGVVPEATYVDMPSPCAAYNSDALILERVGEIVGIAETHGLYGVRVDTVLVFDSQEIVDARCGGDAAIFGYTWEAAVPLLEDMADTGGGAFQDLFVGDRDPTDPPTVPPTPPVFECDDRFGGCGAPDGG